VERTRRQPTFLNLDAPYPQHIFTVVVWGESRAQDALVKGHVWREPWFWSARSTQRFIWARHFSSSVSAAGVARLAARRAARPSRTSRTS
jgi:hypothetical protein